MRRLASRHVHIVKVGHVEVEAIEHGGREWGRRVGRATEVGLAGTWRAAAAKLPREPVMDGHDGACALRKRVAKVAAQDVEANEVAVLRRVVEAMSAIVHVSVEEVLVLEGQGVESGLEQSTAGTNLDAIPERQVGREEEGRVAPGALGDREPLICSLASGSTEFVQVLGALACSARGPHPQNILVERLEEALAELVKVLEPCHGEGSRERGVLDIAWCVLSCIDF